MVLPTSSRRSTTLLAGQTEVAPTPVLAARTVSNTFLATFVSRFDCTTIGTIDFNQFQFQSISVRILLALRVFLERETLTGPRPPTAATANGTVERLPSQLRAAITMSGCRSHRVVHLLLTLLGLQFALKQDDGCSAAGLV